MGIVIVFSFQWVCSIDLAPNEEADANVIVTELNNWQAQDKQVQDRVAEVLAGEKLDGIFCVASGWAGCNAASKSTKILITMSKTLFDKECYFH